MHPMFRSRLPVTRRGWVIALYLAAALVLGGGGSPSALPEMLIQLAFAAGVLTWALWARGPLDGRGLPRELVWLAALPIVLCALQLIPLPPAVWHALPGRGLEVRALGLVDAADSWRPLSIAPLRTLAALLAIVPACALMLGVAQLGHRDRRAVLLVIAATGLAGAVLGALQLAGQGAVFRPYKISHAPWLTGFYANRNSAADAFLIAMLALGAWALQGSLAAARARDRLVPLAAAFLLLTTALVLTGSRAGIALFAIVLPILLVMARDRLPAVVRRRRVVAGAAGLAALAVLGPLVLQAVPRLGEVAARFAVSGDARPQLWADSWYVARQFWPSGSGIGTFAAAFLPFEPLDRVDATVPSRAHFDYLEVVIEAGLAGVAGMVLAAVLAIRLVLRAARNATVLRPVLLFAVGTLLVTALHSLVDYPLRSMAIASLVAAALGMLAAPAQADKNTGSRQ